MSGDEKEFFRKALTVCRCLVDGDHETATRLAQIVLDDCESFSVATPCREGVLGCDVEGVHRHGTGSRKRGLQ